MILRLILGNAASFAAAVFLILSSNARVRERIYFFQLIECILLVGSQIFFLQIGTAAVLLVSIIRNILLIKNSYSMGAIVSVNVASLFFGIAFSSGGAISLFPVIAAIVYNTFAVFKDVALLKLGLIVTLSLWIVYSASIPDIFGFIVNTVSLILNLISSVRLLRSK